MNHSVKFDQRIYQENLILKRVLYVTVIQPGDQNDPLDKFAVNTSAPITYIQSANAELRKNPEIKSMLEKKTLFDIIFSDVLSQPQRYGYSYLLECF